MCGLCSEKNKSAQNEAEGVEGGWGDERVMDAYCCKICVAPAGHTDLSIDLSIARINTGKNTNPVTVILKR